MDDLPQVAALAPDFDIAVNQEDRQLDAWREPCVPLRRHSRQIDRRAKRGRCGGRRCLSLCCRTISSHTSCGKSGSGGIHLCELSE